jgi:hypothetical protein
MPFNPANVDAMDMAAMNRLLYAGARGNTTAGRARGGAVAGVVVMTVVSALAVGVVTAIAAPELLTAAVLGSLAIGAIGLVMLAGLTKAHASVGPALVAGTLAAAAPAHKNVDAATTVNVGPVALHAREGAALAPLRAAPPAVMAPATTRTITAHPADPRDVRAPVAVEKAEETERDVRTPVVVEDTGKTESAEGFVGGLRPFTGE